MKGIIKKLDDRMFGFITVEGMKDVFFHANDCGGNFKDFKEGDTVTFETADSDKGPKAINVKLDNGMDSEAAPEEEAAPEADESEEE